MTRRLKILAMVLIVTLMAACNEDEDFVPPSFIHLDAINIGPSPVNDIAHGDPNFYTSDVVAAFVVAHYPDERKVDTIGLFRLPFTVPVLYSGEVDYIEFYPGVMVSGISGALTFYTFYNKIRIEDTVLTSGDTLDFGTQTTCYNPQTDFPMLFEPFEPTEGGVAMDSVVEWVKHDRDNACSGEGYGRVSVRADQTGVPFYIEKIGSRDYFIFTDATKYYYMELDIRSDLEVNVWMKAAYTSGGNESQESIMNIYPTDGEWRHLYIMLGRTWSTFNHPASVKLGFTALNLDGIDGEVLIDNIKVISTSVVF